LCVFVDLGIQHAKLMLRITLSSVACPAAPKVSTLSHKRKNFRQEVIEAKICVVFLSALFSETFVILTGNERDVFKNVYWSYVKYRYSCQILMKIEFSRDIFVKILNVKFLENSSIGSRVVPCERSDGQMDRRDETNIHFSQFCEPA
jgi:hypothetical protein